MQDELIKKEICCIIVTYNPDVLLSVLVDSIYNQVDSIIIVDNNSDYNGSRIITDESKKINIRVIRNNQNFGIARALNQGVLRAGELKYRWAITFDQDSTPFGNIISTINEVYSLYPEKDRIGAIGVNYRGRYQRKRFCKSDTEKFCEKDYLITSGCLLSIEACLELGGFREDFFIDNVDLEYSLRLRKNGKVLLLTKAEGMQHKPGDPGIKNYFGIKLESTNHNRTRRYYMSRNHVILTREYFFRFPFFISKLNYFYLASLLKIILVDDDKKAKIIASIKGIKDGLFFSPGSKKLISSGIRSVMI
jgi:rhamnosyltransferase